MRMLKKSLALLLAAVMLSTLLPATVLAEELNGNGESATEDSVIPPEDAEADTQSETTPGETEEDAVLVTNEGSINPESATKDAENELTAENERDTPTKDNITEERDADAVLQSMMPLEEVRLETVDLTGYFATELTAVKLETLLPGVDLSDGSAIVWTTQGDDSYTVTDKNGTIDLSSYVSTYSNSRSYEIIVGTPDQLDRTNTRYLVTVRFDSPDLRDSLHVDAVYSNEERDDVGFLNHYFDADYTRQEDNQTGERGWIGLYEISVGETWQNSSVYLSMSRDANWPETLTAEVYEGTYLSLDSLDQAGDSANKITDKVWEKATVLKTAASTDLYEANCGTDRIDDAPKFTIVWKRGDTNVAVMPFMLWIYDLTCKTPGCRG